MLLPSNPDPLEGLVNLDAEQALLGCMLAKQHLFGDLTVKAEYFYEALHQDIFAQAASDIRENGSASALLIGEKFGDKAYVAKLIASSVHVINPEDYADLVANLWAARQMTDACLQAQERLKQGEQAATIAEELTAKVNATVEQRSWLNIRDDYQVTEAILDDMKRDVEPVPTGIKGIDLAMDGGLHPGFSYGFAARKKVGKTVLASTISFNLNNAGVKHLFIACEMGSKQIHQRNLARGAKVEPVVFRDSKKQSPDKLNAIASYAMRSKRCIKYLDAPGLTFDGLKQAVGVAVAKHKISGVILDYWQLVGGKRKNQSTAEHLDEVAQWIADYCRKHGIWSIVMAQVNQEGNTRGGEGLRLAFDQVYQLHREDVSLPGAWLEMLDTRYTKWMNVGSSDNPRLFMAEESPYFYET